MTASFTAGDHPTVEAVVDAVLALVPEAQREAARAYIEAIVRHRMAGLSTHPRPAGLAEVVYERLAESIQDAGPEGLLQRLQEEALATEVDSLYQDSLALAVARYGSDHPDKSQLANAWAAHRADWLNRDAGFYAAKADELKQEHERLQRSVGEAPPAVAGRLRPELLRVNLNLGSARTGIFATASGSLADFLRDVGADFQYMDFE